jgi:hypothetical protein
MTEEQVTGQRPTSDGVKRAWDRANDEFNRLNKVGSRIHNLSEGLLYFGIATAFLATLSTALLPDGANRIVGAILAALATAGASVSAFLTPKKAAEKFGFANAWRRLREDIADFQGYWQNLREQDAWDQYKDLRDRASALEDKETAALAQEDRVAGAVTAQHASSPDKAEASAPSARS